MLMNRLESIYLDIDYPVLDLPMDFAVDSMLSLLQLILIKEYNKRYVQLGIKRCFLTTWNQGG